MINRAVRYVQRRRQAAANRQAREAVLPYLRQSIHPAAAPICGAIEAIYAPLPPEESLALARIDDLQTTLQQSDRTINTVDYGAGSPDSPRSLSEARGGVTQAVKMSRLAKGVSISHPWSRLLYELVRHLRPYRILELGTCLGFSAAHICAALEITDCGYLISIEGSPPLYRTAAKNLASLGYGDDDTLLCGTFEEKIPTLPTDEKIDLVYNDGHHDGQAARKYLDTLRPALNDNAVLLFDDVDVYDSMRDFWADLQAESALSVDFGKWGLVVLDGPEKESYGVPLP